MALSISGLKDAFHDVSYYPAVLAAGETFESDLKHVQ